MQCSNHNLDPYVCLGATDIATTVDGLHDQYLGETLDGEPCSDTSANVSTWATYGATCDVGPYEVTVSGGLGLVLGYAPAVTIYPEVHGFRYEVVVSFLPFWCGEAGMVNVSAGSTSSPIARQECI